VKLAVADYLLRHPEKSARDIRIACYGLAFKPDIDDLRESPSLNIARQLGDDLGVGLLLIEPNIEELPEGLIQHQLVDIAHALGSAHVHVLLVKHREFTTMFKMRDDAVVIDAAGVFAA
jgi:UDP-N-acetyl-D-mannosaminuronic acid dehydrogenase